MKWLEMLEGANRLRLAKMPMTARETHLAISRGDDLPQIVAVMFFVRLLYGAGWYV